MRSLPVFRPSASLVLHHVPQTMTKEDISQLFIDFKPIDNIVFHYITPNIYTECVTVVLGSVEAAKNFSTKYFNHTIPNTNITFHYSFRPNDCSISQPISDEIVYKQQLDDVPPDFNPYSKNYFISDWSHFSDLQSIPTESILVNLRYNEIESFDIVLESLTTLNLIGNNLKYILPLTKLPKLENLNISYNLLQHLPTFSKTITIIDASHNQIIDIDKSIIDAENLACFNASYNCIKEIPPLPHNLKRIFLNNNQIEKIDEFSVSKSLIEFKIDNNKITEIPNTLKNHFSTQNLRFNSFKIFDLSIFVSNIREVNLSMCNLTEFPLNAFKMRSLSTLILYGNNIDQIPSEFSTSHLTSLDISMNPISELPRISQRMLNLRINHCNLTDICNSIPDNNNLKFFHAVGNKLSKLPRFDKIEELFVSGNKITEFPNLSFQSLAKKIFIDLSHNLISEVPEFTNKNFALFDISFNPIKKVSDKVLSENSGSFNFSGIPDLNMELNEFSIPKVSFLNIFNTSIRLIPPKVKKQTFIEKLSKNSDLKDQNTYLMECNESVGFSDTIGKRESMEDAMFIRQHFSITENNSSSFKTAIFGLFDGHGGPTVSKWAAISFYELFKIKLNDYLVDQTSSENNMIPLKLTKEVDAKTVLDVCDDFHSKIISSNETSGSTMDLAILHSDGRAIIAHMGDSKTAIYDKNGHLLFANIEQRPDLRSELERLRDEKVRIRRNRTAGILAMSRSLGDVQVCGVSHVPTFDEFEIDKEKAKWLVIACDGVWDDLDLESAGRIVAKANNAAIAANFLRNEGLARGSEDNTTAIVVDLETVFED